MWGVAQTPAPADVRQPVRFLLGSRDGEVTGGFVNQIAGEPRPDGTLRFDSESILNIEPNEFIERFRLAAPGQDFELYPETRFRRTK